jgi:hypothetical protein
MMAQEDLLGDHLKAEYQRLVGEKERLRARCARIKVDLERRR